MKGPIHAVIGVARGTQGRTAGRTAYFLRSDKLENYKGVWSLLSSRFDPETLDFLNLDHVQAVFTRMAEERLGTSTISVLRYLTSGSCARNPMNRRVVLHLYEVSVSDIRLNPDFYTDYAYLTPDEYEKLAKGKLCGLCMQLWSDYALKHGLVAKRFAPEPQLIDEHDFVGH